MSGIKTGRIFKEGLDIGFVLDTVLFTLKYYFVTIRAYT